MNTSIKTALIAASAAAAIGLAAAPAALADDEVAATTAYIGQQAKLTDGAVVQGWTITGLKPSTDVIPYTPQGTLWEATATNQAIQGSVQPIVSNLNARTADGQNYRVLFGVATPQGVNPGALAQGDSTSGKVYFDVTGATPDTVVYNAGGHDLLVWKPAPPAPPATGGSGSSWTAPAQSAPAATTPGTAAPAATGSSGTPITEGTTPAPAAAGSSGTPITEGTTPTPAPAAADSAGTPAGPAPAAAGSSGTPASEGTPAVTPAPAAGSAGTPAPAQGSTGTPAVQSVPTTTVVGIPHGMGSSGTPAS